MYLTKNPFALWFCLIAWLLVTGTAGADIMVTDTFIPSPPTVTDPKYDPTPVLPDARAGTYSFTARFCNNNGPDMAAGLETRTITLANNNVLLNRDPDTSTGTGAGSRLHFSAKGDYTNLSLLHQPKECAEITYQIGLKRNRPFDFTVDVWLARTVSVTASGPSKVQEGHDVRLHADMGPLDTGETPTYAWVQEIVGSEPTVPLTDADTDNPGFIAPALDGIPKLPETLRFKVTATLNGKSQEKFVDVEVDAGKVIVNAGQNTSATAGDLVSLHATSVPHSPVSWHWVQTRGDTVILTDGDTENPTFTAPAAGQTLEFEAYATVGADSGVGRVLLNVIRQTTMVVTAGGDISATSGHLVNLNCTASGGVPDTEAWSQVDTGVPTVPLTGADTLHASFTAPVVASATVFEFQCQAFNQYSHGLGLMHVTVTPPAVPLTADAGPDQDVLEGAIVHPYGNGSGGTGFLSYSWVETTSVGVTINNPSSQTPSFEAPAVDSDTLVTLTLTVTDSTIPNPESISNSVTYTVKGRSMSVTANVDAGVVSNGAVHLHALPQGGLPPVTYDWTEITNTGVILDNRTSPNPSFTAPTVTTDTTLTFKVVATDAVKTTPNTDMANVDVLVKAPASPLTVTVGSNLQTAASGHDVTLSGNATGGTQPYTYAWTASPTVTFSPNATVQNPTYPQPGSDVTLTLTVTDGNNDTALDNATITTTASATVPEFAPIIAMVCNGPLVICEQRYREQRCTVDKPYAINYLRNLADGSRTVNRRCGIKEECQNDWWVTSSDDDKCTTFDSDALMSYAFECTWCCITDRCNEPIRPADGTLFVGIS